MYIYIYTVNFFVLYAAYLLCLNQILDKYLKKKKNPRFQVIHTPDNFLTDLYQALSQYSMDIILKPTNPLDYDSVQPASSPF